MTLKKIRLSDFSKDIHVPVTELIQFFSGLNPNETPKKSGTGLTEEEINLALEHYTQQSAVTDFSAYFASTMTRESYRNSVNTAGTTRGKTAETPKTASGEKKKSENAKPKQSPLKKSTSTAATRATTQTNAPVQEENRRQARPAPSSAKESSPVERKARPRRELSEEKPTATKEMRSNSSAPREISRSVSNEKSASEKRVAPSAKTPKESAPVKPTAPKKEPPQRREHPTKQPVKAQQHGQRLVGEMSLSEAPRKATRTTVDTRGSYVDLDKYNQRYEQMASTSGKYGKENYSSKKQKINQKSANRNKQKYSNKRESEQDKLRRLELERARKQQLKVLIPDTITVSELATRLKATATDVIKHLMKLGVMATINEEIDFDTAAVVAEEMGAKVEHEVVVTIEERLIDVDDETENTQERPPVVTIMGHVDHGKTSILDKIRNSNITEGEAGGITQHIGAYQVQYQGKDITFLDTPGHEAFTSMRARGANITDIAILVVAADDGIMPQTIESINHAKAANVSVIVAINKMDKEGADPDRVREELTKYGLVCEEWGGDVICVPVSAKTGEGIDDLLENILLVAEMSELKANPNRRAKGAVVEARLDKGRGPIATLLVQNGTLHTGDVLIAGTSVGRVRTMMSDKGLPVDTAGPSVPVEITGLAEVPEAGDSFNAVADERLARELVEQRKHEAKQAKFEKYQKVTLDNLFSQIEEGQMKELSLIVKADVQGSVEAVTQSLEKLSNDEVRVRVIHGGVGGIRESDIMLASASNAIIIGFNVRPDQVAEDLAARDNVEIRTYRVIYDAIEEVRTAMKGMLAPKYREIVQGRAEVRQVMKLSSVGAVAGAYVQSGKITRQSLIRVVRDGFVIAEDKMSSLRRFKDDVREVAEKFECGITLEKFSDFKEGDIFEAFILEEYRD